MASPLAYPVPEADRIILYSSTCFGFCPEFCLSVDANGEMEFWGGQFADKNGFFTAQVPDTLLKEVSGLFDQPAWMKVDDGYDTGIVDAVDKHILYLHQGRIIKNIKDKGSKGPDFLKKAYHLFDQLYKLNTWSAMEACYFTCMPLPCIAYEMGEASYHLHKVESFFLWQNWKKAGGSMTPEFEIEVQPILNPNPSDFDVPRQPNCLLGDDLPLSCVATDGQTFFLMLGHAHLLKVDVGYSFFEENVICIHEMEE